MIGNLFNNDTQLDQENLLNNIDQITNLTYILNIKKFFDSKYIKKDDHIVSILKKAEKKQDDNFLLIQACKNSHFQNNQESIDIYLFDYYTAFCNVKIGMQIRVSGEFINSNTIIFTKTMNNKNVFILEPEILVAPSTLSGLEYCERKQFIKKFFKYQCFGTRIEFLGGNVIHEFFQNIIENPQNFSQLFQQIEQLDELQKNLDLLVLENMPKSFLEPIYKLYSKFFKEFYYLEKKTIREMIVYILPGCVNSLKWINEHIIKQLPIYDQYEHDVYEIQILRWISNEQLIQSSIYGLKGYIDIVVQVKYRKNNEEFKICNAPIELKTGSIMKQKNNLQQVTTYLMLMNNQYSQESKIGLLLLLSKLKNQVIIENQSEISKIMFNRNRYIQKIFGLEKYKNFYNQLPNLKDEIKCRRDVNQKCIKCDVKSVCYGLHILTEQSELTFFNPDYNEISAQLKPKSREYLNMMLKNLRHEEQITYIPQATYKILETQNLQTGTQVILQSKKSYLKQFANEMLQQCFIDKEVIDLFCIRTQQNQKYILQNIQLIQSTQIINLIEDQINSNNEAQDEQNFDYLIRLQIFIEQEPLNGSASTLQINDELIHKLFKKNLFKHYKFIIFELVTNKDFYNRKKEILIFGMEPKFKLITEMDDNQKCAFTILQQKFQNYLNEYQFKAIQLCLLSQDFALIQGGYGKRKMLSHLLFLLGYMNKKVLFFAADNEILDQQIDNFIEIFPNECDWILRLSNEKDKIQESYQQFTIDFTKYKDIQEIEKKLENKHFYFSTCQNCTDILQSELFDYCVVDQSTKIIEPLCISCILKSRIFILLDDQKIQQPEIKSQKAKQLKISLFQRLSEQFKNSNCLQELQLQVEDIEDLI
ncbi:unnamed protein product [Paramecium sonneborni]|uniref:DNA replication ATP-dependent helicase/nuclease n=1 Tax=Paramecium sonneborni TaxID=65129 RepID=A0A8S1PTB9_9CILI|nr:unnamed protein product [Paramecium sonneborni]